MGVAHGFGRARQCGLRQALRRKGGLLLAVLLSRELRVASGVDKGFETCLTRLQMQTYITVSGFEYLHDKHGVPYGWGVARYALSESVFGEALTRSAYMHPPAESHSRLMDRLRELCPESDGKALLKLIK